MDKITLWFVIGFVVLIAVVVIVAGVVSGGFSNGTSSTSTPAGFVATTVPAITPVDWTEGNPKAAVTVIEYGDYECPACGAWSPIFDQLVAAYSSTVLFAFRNFPLYTIHPDAQVGAQAAEAAGLQGKYWQMHELLYQNQATWSIVAPGDATSQYFNGYATSIGLNVAQFDTDMNSATVTQKIAADVASGNAAQIDHTPTFFVNQTQIVNPTDYNSFKAVLDQAIASSTAS